MHEPQTVRPFRLLFQGNQEPEELEAKHRILQASRTPSSKAEALGWKPQSFQILISYSALLNTSLCNKQTGDFNQQLPFPREYVKISDLQTTASCVSILSWDKLGLRFPVSQMYCKVIMLKNKHCL